MAMANQFAGNPGTCISWANGLTSVMLARVTVAAAELARTDWEDQFARWIATIDQNRGPLGCVGFDLDELPWGTAAEFPDRRRFVVEAVVHAASTEVAHRLPYYPNPAREDLHRELLREYALMAHHFDPSLSPNTPATDWPYLFPPSDVMCRRHHLFCHSGGCMVCSDDGHYTIAGSSTVRPG
jgi:hypothetical protein